MREDRKPVAFLFADIDDMKSINDNHGHETGDTASSTLPSRSVISPPEEAKTLKECIQMADARMYTVKKSRHIARGQ
ncbi:diguanylate cyclase domain-containing protein [Eubacterium pyruvativorans]|uniref:diguanylate cyclase domain-containing protein n=1 Tax=Eubacterium pyruvativorans TaxID=155865 RepID=UPI000B7E98AD